MNSVSPFFSEINDIMTQVKSFSVSDNTTAVVLIYISPTCIREYRIERISNAFCIVRINKLAYFRPREREREREREGVLKIKENMLLFF